MNDKTTIKGLWWLPDKPEKQLVGEITYGPNSGARLSLLDHFFQSTLQDKFTVWGTTASGKLISLFDCYTDNLKMHMPGARVAEVSSYFGVVGGHFKSPDQMKFIKVTADLSYVHEWAWTSGITYSLKDSGKRWEVAQDMLPDVSLGSVDDFNLALAFTGHLSPGYGDFKLSENCLFTVEAKTLTDYESFEKVVHRFQHFVALGVSRPVYALSVKAQIDTPKTIIQGQSIYEEYEIIRELSLSQETQKSLTPREMQFCLADLKPDPSKFIKRFFDKHQLLEPVCDLYFSTLYNRDSYLQQRFLALAYAVEAYHRAFVGGKYQSDDEYQNGIQITLWNAIPPNIDADFRASLKNKLKYLHEFSLRKRVLDICEKFSPILRPFLGESAPFAGGVADQRNMLTHPDSTIEDGLPAIDWTALWLKCEQLSLLLEVCLLHELGLSEQAISALLPRNRRTSAIQLNRK